MSQSTPSADWSAHVFPHGPLRRLDDRLWYVEGKLKHGHMPRTMTVYKLDSGGLLIHSAIALNEGGVRELEALGKPEVLIVPNPIHRLDAGVYKARYPGLQVVCPRATTEKASAKVHVDGACEDVLPGLGVIVHTMDGVKPIELCYELPVKGGTALVFTDALMNLKHLPGFGGWLARVLGSTGFFGITLIGRLFLLKSKVAFRQWLHSRGTDSNIQFIIVAHGDVIDRDCQEKLREAAERLA